MKWDLIDRNPAVLAEVPTHETKRREIWDLQTLAHVNEVCPDNILAVQRLVLWPSCTYSSSDTPEKSLIGFENVPCDFIFFSDLSGCLNNTLLLRHTYSHRIPGAFH